LIWVMHNHWLHWRHSGDQALRDRIYPLLKAAVGYSLARLQLGADGRLHLPEAVSPEFPKTAPDTNYDLSLLRWGLQTLLTLQGPGAADAQSARWRDTLARLTPYPVGPTGYLIGRGQPLDQSHRHFSHLLMIYPLRLVTGERPGERELIEKSLAHWIGFEGALQGYSFVGASAISSMLGKGEDAERHLDELIRRFVKPNTMYLEAGPVIETPLAAAQAVHEMLLQSWDGQIRVFPAVPARWQDASFHHLRAEGAFLVSAVRRGGRNVWVQVHSEQGEPARLRVDMPDAQISSAKGGTAEKQPDGSWKLTLARGQTLELRAPGRSPEQWQVSPVSRPGPAVPFGLP
jgi:alpha-L-fucosidase 2